MWDWDLNLGCKELEVYAYKAINNAHKDPFNNQTVKSKFSF